MGKKIILMALSALLLIAAATGCRSGEVKKEDGKINISIAGWPDETNPNGQKNYEGYVKQMSEIRPDVNVIPDTNSYADAKMFQMKAAANQLPTMFGTHFTEIQKVINGGYAADITDILKERGLYDALNPELLELGKGKDGKVYALPTNAYLMGLTVNRNLFEEAGLIDDKGAPMIPDTYEQLAEYGQIIKEKTGKSGFSICTANNCGGWHFMNIAWSYGVKFMKQREDGTWEATFNTPECIEALQYIKDLKWKYNILPNESVIDQQTNHKLLGVGQTAMIFEAPSNDYTQKYGMDPANFAMGKMPAGPKGRYVQMGGSVNMFTKSATEEEINACFDWLELIGNFKTDLDEAAIANREKSYQNTIDLGGIVMPKTALPLWTNPERIAAEKELMGKYSNVSEINVAGYLSMEGVILTPEEPVACQQLYAVLDGCIQEVITNENADPAALIETACRDFQVNHLDKL